MISLIFISRSFKLYIPFLSLNIFHLLLSNPLLLYTTCITIPLFKYISNLWLFTAFTNLLHFTIITITVRTYYKLLILVINLILNYKIVVLSHRTILKYLLLIEELLSLDRILLSTSSPLNKDIRVWVKLLWPHRLSYLLTLTSNSRFFRLTDCPFLNFYLTFMLFLLFYHYWCLN